MQTVTIPEQEYLQMKQSISNFEAQLNLFQDVEFMKKLQVFILLYLQNQQLTLKYLPITEAKKDENDTAFGMWADREIDQNTLRKQAWGNRL
jgi:hypothetical protein